MLVMYYMYYNHEHKHINKYSKSTVHMLKAYTQLSRIVHLLWSCQVQRGRKPSPISMASFTICGLFYFTLSLNQFSVLGLVSLSCFSRFLCLISRHLPLAEQVTDACREPLTVEVFLDLCWHRTSLVCSGGLSVLKFWEGESYVIHVLFGQLKNMGKVIFLVLGFRERKQRGQQSYKWTRATHVNFSEAGRRACALITHF